MDAEVQCVAECHINLATLQGALIISERPTKRYQNETGVLEVRCTSVVFLCISDRSQKPAPMHISAKEPLEQKVRGCMGAAAVVNARYKTI